MEPLFVPGAENVTSFGETVTLQGPLASCVMFTLWPATTIDAERAVVPPFDPIVYATLPDPVPVVPLVSTTQAASA